MIFTSVLVKCPYYITLTEKKSQAFRETVLYFSGNVLWCPLRERSAPCLSLERGWRRSVVGSRKFSPCGRKKASYRPREYRGNNKLVPPEEESKLQPREYRRNNKLVPPEEESKLQAQPVSGEQQNSSSAGKKAGYRPGMYPTEWGE